VKNRVLGNPDIMKLVKKGKQEKEIEEKLPCMENIIR
jgi:hypothetical protein